MAEEQADDPVQDNAPPAYAIYMYDPVEADLADRGLAADGLHVHRPGRDAGARRAERHRADQRRPDACRPQGLALIEVRSVYDTDGLRRMGEQMLTEADLAAGCDSRHRAHGGTRRPDRDPSPGGRPRAHQEPGRPGLPLRAGALRARHARGRAAGQFDGPAQRDRRDQLRAAADPRLRAGRARRLVQAARCRPTCRWRLPSSTPRAARSRPTPTGSRCARVNAAPATAATARAAAVR